MELKENTVFAQHYLLKELLHTDDNYQFWLAEDINDNNNIVVIKIVIQKLEAINDNTEYAVFEEILYTVIPYSEDDYKNNEANQEQYENYISDNEDISNLNQEEIVKPIETKKINHKKDENKKRNGILIPVIATVIIIIIAVLSFFYINHKTTPPQSENNLIDNDTTNVELITTDSIPKDDSLNSLNPDSALMDSLDSFNFDYEMVWVEGGTFEMGCTSEQGNECIDDEIPVHKVSLKGFFIGKYELTQKQWKEIIGNNPSYFKGCDNCPVENIDWLDAKFFIKKLNEKTGLNYRLPTEAEWEFAARGGNKTKGYKYSGSNNINAVAWWNKNADNQTHPVGKRQANELGIYDMSGNVYEWCENIYGEYPETHQKNPISYNSKTNHRAYRGGCWRYYANNCRISARYKYLPDVKYDFLGIRLARNK